MKTVVPGLTGSLKMKRRGHEVVGSKVWSIEKSKGKVKIGSKYIVHM